jgi:hypothetical protein
MKFAAVAPPSAFAARHGDRMSERAAVIRL